MRDDLSWQKILAEGFKSVNELLEYLSLPLELGSQQAEQFFKTRVPRGFAARMQPQNPNDPLLLQILAKPDELLVVDGYNEDPLIEKDKNVLKGLIHKYHGRVLLTLTGVCAVNCRYCFRRHFPYKDNNPGSLGWQNVLDYIRKDSTIEEVIFSGGDPLLASDEILAEIMDQLELIPHVKTLRIHTRIPIVLPERITASFLSILKESRLNKLIVVHANHAQELNDDVAIVANKLSKAECQLLNQSVLLTGINDKADVLVALSKRLFELKIMPYYLHVLDKVLGAAHFDMPLQKALSLHQAMQANLPGYLVPRLVKESPGEKSKTLLF
ncbi:MAG: EF-P beta-lysylation protein EpmB [Proteobacteria bacterium]|nr:EF-P beta-lysylation protein EpmB [Pseudomonadota bacterium]